jgi:hypothetical protein
MPRLSPIMLWPSQSTSSPSSTPLTLKIIRKMGVVLLRNNEFEGRKYIYQHLFLLRNAS